MPRKIGLSSRAKGGEERVKVDLCSSGFIPRLLVILFTTEGAEHTEKMIKNMFYLLCLLCEARSASVFSVVMFCRRGFMPRRIGLSSRATSYGPKTLNLIPTRDKPAATGIKKPCDINRKVFKFLEPRTSNLEPRTSNLEPRT